MPFSLTDIREHFPILHEQVHGHALVYLDNAATTQKPKAVIESITDMYEHHNANVHRGVHSLSTRSTSMLEQARERVAQFIGAKSAEQIVFTRGTTESINLIASTYGRQHVGAGDEVVVSLAEHHSNFVPWQQLCLSTGATLRVASLKADSSLDMQALGSAIGERTKIVAIAHASNVTGLINPIADIIQMAHSVGAVAVVDAAQTTPHLAIDVERLGADFLAFSGHKMYAPTGIGILYGKRELLESMQPYQFGGEMIGKVRTDVTTFNGIPFRFEAGTPNYVGAIALARAIDFVADIGLEAIAEAENSLTQYAIERLQSIEGLRIIGAADAPRTPVVSFVIDGTHPYDIGMLLDQFGVAVRTGHHCAEPLIDSLGIPGTVRASFAMYNTQQEVDKLVEGLQRVLPMLR